MYPNVSGLTSTSRRGLFSQLFEAFRRCYGHFQDVYRLLQQCLSPLSGDLGSEPYADRVHASQAVKAQPEALRFRRSAKIVTGSIFQGRSI